MDMLKRDRFELLSAYLDGEVTACERRQVEDWLANDPESQRLYGRLLTLRQGLQTMPVPSTQQSVENTIEQVYQRMHRRSRHRTAGIPIRTQKRHHAHDPRRFRVCRDQRIGDLERTPRSDRPWGLGGDRVHRRRVRGPHGRGTPVPPSGEGHPRRGAPLGLARTPI